MIVYTARHVLSVASPQVTDGAVAVHEGRIAAVGRKTEVLKAVGDGAEVHDLGDAVLLPGLVNAHVHLDLSWMRDDPPPGGSYVAWFRDRMERVEQAPDPIRREATEKAVAEMAARGTVAVGDAAGVPWTAGILARSPLHAVVFVELTGFRTEDAERLLDRAASSLDSIENEPDVKAARGRVGVVLSPHSAHTVSASLLKALAGRATASGEILSIHLAETPDEAAMLMDGSGPFPGLLRARGGWDEGWHAPGHSPVEYLDRLGVLCRRTLAIHCIHLGQQDMSKLQARGVTVVTCPRSNLRLGVGKTPVPKLLSAGIPVALGTDSLASVSDLDLFFEMAGLRREHPTLSPAAVLRMATLNGARALRLESNLGTLEKGKLAALAAVSLSNPHDDPLEAVTSGPETVTVLPAPVVGG
ncbi:MAG: amidohydrolase family protein [Acidobacteriia bacterium]|nr:amidohydrolase family protein [Terriglobia bacterium]